MSSSADVETKARESSTAAAEEKRRLLLRLLQQRSGGASPLSPGQRALWFLEKLTPGTAVFHLSRGSWFEGELDTAAFAAAAHETARRQAAVRTRFHEVGSRPVQMVSDEPGRVLMEVDLTALPAGERRPAAETLARRTARRPFDLGRAPLLRMLLIRLGERSFLISVTFHHIVSDAWSFGVLSAELWSHYQAFVEGRPSPLPPLPMQPVEHTRRQLRWLESEACAREVAFWREQLAGAPSSLEIPTGRPRPALRGHRGGEHWQVISRQLVDGLQAVAEESRVTLFMAFLAVFAAQIHRLTGRRDFLVGAPVSGRNRPEVMGLVGYFVNMLPYRLQPGGGLTVKELLGQVRATTLETMAHQELPFEKLVEELDPDRDLGNDPLFQVVFNVVPFEGGQGAGSDGLELDGDPQVSDFVISHGTAMFDLEVYLEEEEGGDWKFFLRWRTDLFDSPFAVRFVDQYRRLVAAAVDDPDRRLRELPLLSAAERQQLLEEWNQPRAVEPRRESFLELFEARVVSAPDAVAAVSPAGAVSYRQLDRRAARIGRWLRERGVGRESQVGLFGGRGIGMLTAILGAQKAGAAWVPLDPGHPDARVAAVLAAAGVEVILAEGRLAERLEGIASAASPAPELRCWDDPAWAATPEAGETAVETPQSHPHDLANVFFTSGSTGVPKGVMVEQLGMVNHLMAKVELAGLDAGSTVVQNASHCFDISVWQFLAPLVVGGRVVIVDDDTALDPAKLLAVVERQRVTVLETVPTLLTALVESAGGEGDGDGEQRLPASRLPALRLLISNAETLPVSLARRWLELFPRVPLVNTYGATECSDDTTHEIFHAPPPRSAPRVAVGTPIRGFAIYVLDRHLRPTPPGLAGQIAMSGVGVGRGYLGAPATTAAIYVPHPFAVESGERLYLTRDLGYFDPDGTLEFLGRIDNQVKVRGYRIEVGEVESALDRHPEVQQAAVVVFGGDGAARLVGYFVAREEVDGAELRSLLTDLLPQYMVPEQLVQLPAMPLNRNGKIDRDALPEPAAASTTGEHVAPRNDLEARIAEIWRSVLGVEEVSVHADFFELGGHSLKAVQLATRLRQELDRELEVRQLFLHPTVAELAAHLGGTEGRGAPELPAIERRDDLTSYPLTVAQEAMWTSFQILSSDVRKLPEILELRGPVHRESLRAAAGAVVARHDAVRTAFFEERGEPRQRIVDDVDLPWREDDLAGVAGDELPAALDRILGEESEPFDLARPPLLRLRLLRLAEDRHLLLVTLPHIVSDGGSEEVLFRELARCYTRLRRGGEDGEAAEAGELLPPLELRYVDFAAWQRELLRGPTLDAERDFWLDRLRDAPPPVELPADRLGDGETPARAATEVLDDDLPERVEKLAAAHGATPFMVYLAGFHTLLERWTGVSDQVVGSALAGRFRPELEEMIGLFTHPVALRTEVVPGGGFEELVRKVRDTTLEALAHQSYPFHSWLGELRRERRDAQYVPYTVTVMPQRKPALEPFDGLEARFRQPTDVFDEAVSGAGGDANAGGDGEAAEAETPDALEQLTGLGVDLTLGVLETDDGVRLLLAAGTGKFRQATLDRLLGQLRAVLEQVVEDPGRPLSELELPGAEKPPAELEHVELDAEDLDELFGEPS